MSRKISVLSQVNLLPNAQQLVAEFAGHDICFPVDSPNAEEVLVARTEDSEAILIGLSVKLGSSYLDACPAVKYVGLCGTATANVDLGALAARGVAFSNVVGYGDEPTAEFIFMQLVKLARGVGPYQWKSMPRELMGKSLTIIGLGALGKAMADLAIAYKMQVNYYSKHRKRDWEERGLQFGELRDLLPRSDVVVTSLATDVKVLGETEFAAMKNETIFVQASIGETFEKQAFLRWISRGNNFAILDYAAGEQNHQTYKDLPRVIFPRIVAGHTQETKERLGQKVLENLKSYFEKSRQ